jgi:hypothetical protein
METKESAVITFRVTPDELQTIETNASQANITRADYVRGRALAPDNTARIQALEKQLHELTDRLGREAKNDGRPCSHKCSQPEHYKIWGVGYCFDCDMPMKSSH